MEGNRRRLPVIHVPGLQRYLPYKTRARRQMRKFQTHNLTYLLVKCLGILLNTWVPGNQSSIAKESVSSALSHPSSTAASLVWIPYRALQVFFMRSKRASRKDLRWASGRDGGFDVATDDFGVDESWGCTYDRTGDVALRLLPGRLCGATGRRSSQNERRTWNAAP